MGRRRLTIGVMAVTIMVLLISASWAATKPRQPGVGAAAPASSYAPVLGALRPLTGVSARPAPGATRRHGPWSTIWSTAVAAGACTAGGAAARPGTTFRNVVHLTAAGASIRIRLSNRFGTGPVLFGHVTVADAAHGPDGVAVGAAAGEPRTVLFSGRTAVTVPAGADVVGDPLPVAVAGGADLLVSVWTPDGGSPPSYHANARQVSYVADGPRDHAGDVAMTAFRHRTPSWFYVAAVEATGVPGTVVALGDSITDGAHSTSGRNRRWTDYLVSWLAAAGLPPYGVANAGIGGNRVRVGPGAVAAGESALSRLRSDVTGVAGARTVVVLEGINDLMYDPEPASATEVTDALAEIARQCRAAGLRVVGGTLPPALGWHRWDARAERLRQEVNAWIRSGGDGAYDAVADFDAALRDPFDPARLAPRFDAGDHLHPNDAGDEALAAAVPLDAL